MTLSDMLNIATMQGFAGLSLFAVLRWGPGLWPGIVMGDLLANATTGAPREYRLCGMPPPSSGAITIAQILGMLSHTNAHTLAPEPGEELAGGETTVFEAGARAFTLSARNLDVSHESDFFVGNSFFNKNWVVAPSSTRSRSLRNSGKLMAVVVDGSTDSCDMRLGVMVTS